jgi:tetratricopeptide (TPR) repeat protein
MQDRIAGNPSDPLAYAAYAQLGSLYLQKARETGDPSYYSRAEQALTRSLALSPDNALAAVGMGGLSLSRHEFGEALAWGETARAAAPFSHVVYGIIGDALTELGRYDEAVEAIQQMVDRRPDLTSLSRVSYARELHGDLPGAIEVMRRAVEAGNPASEATNWARVQLGHLYFLSGDLDAAGAEYARTLSALPDYVHGLAGQAQVAAARGDLKRAASLYARTQQLAPLPEYAVALAEVYRATGNSAAAARQTALVRIVTQLQRAAGVDVDQELALFEVDQAALAGDRQGIAAALATARSEYERRPLSIRAADTLGWALYRAGRAGEALPYAREALRLGTQDPALLYHAGAIAAAAGSPAEARPYLEAALARNASFHPRLAPEARRLLDQLGKEAR